MGTWGTEPWQNDEALDWFIDMFGDLNVDKIREAFKYYDAWGRIRGACYVLQVIGPYLWPPSKYDDLKDLCEMGIDHLTKVLNPPDSGWDYLELWGNSPEVIQSVQQQIDELKAIRAKVK